MVVLLVAASTVARAEGAWVFPDEDDPKLARGEVHAEWWNRPHDVPRFKLAYRREWAAVARRARPAVRRRRARLLPGVALRPLRAVGRARLGRRRLRAVVSHDRRVARAAVADARDAVPRGALRRRHPRRLVHGADGGELDLRGRHRHRHRGVLRAPLLRVGGDRLGAPRLRRRRRRAAQAEPDRRCARTSRPTRSPSRWGSGCDAGARAGVGAAAARGAGARRGGARADADGGGGAGRRRAGGGADGAAGGGAPGGAGARSVERRSDGRCGEGRRRGDGRRRRGDGRRRRARRSSAGAAVPSSCRRWRRSSLPVALAAFAAALVAGLAQTRLQRRVRRARARRDEPEPWAATSFAAAAALLLLALVAGGRALVASLARADGCGAAVDVTAAALASLTARASSSSRSPGSVNSPGGARSSPRRCRCRAPSAERERREDEGDPRLRAEQRRRQRALARDPLVDEVARAQLVVTAEGVARGAAARRRRARVRGCRRRRSAARAAARRCGAAPRHRRARRRRAGRCAGASAARARRCRRRCRAARNWPCARCAGRLRLSDDARSQGGHPRRRPRHALPAGDQGDPEGDAAHRRRADAAAHRRGGARRRHRGDRARHRPRQVDDRGSLRPQLRARAHAARARQKGAAGAGRAHLEDGAPGDACGRRSRSGSATPCWWRGRRSATSRSPCCSATISTTARAAAGDWPAHRRVRRASAATRASCRCMEVPAGQEQLYGIVAGKPLADAPRTIHITTWWRSRRREPRRRGWRSSGATSCRRRSGTILARTRPGKGGEIQLTDALKELAQTRRRLLRPHRRRHAPRRRRQARLPRRQPGVGAQARRPASGPAGADAPARRRRAVAVIARVAVFAPIERAFDYRGARRG